MPVYTPWGAGDTYIKSKLTLLRKKEGKEKLIRSIVLAELCLIILYEKMYTTVSLFGFFIIA